MEGFARESVAQEVQGEASKQEEEPEPSTPSTDHDKWDYRNKFQFDFEALEREEEEKRKEKQDEEEEMKKLEREEAERIAKAAARKSAKLKFYPEGEEKEDRRRRREVQERRRMKRFAGGRRFLGEERERGAAEDRDLLSREGILARPVRHSRDSARALVAEAYGETPATESIGETSRKSPKLIREPGDYYAREGGPARTDPPAPPTRSLENRQRLFLLQQEIDEFEAAFRQATSNAQKRSQKRKHKRHRKRFAHSEAAKKVSEEMRRRGLQPEDGGAYAHEKFAQQALLEVERKRMLVGEVGADGAGLGAAAGGGGPGKQGAKMEGRVYGADAGGFELREMTGYRPFCLSRLFLETTGRVRVRGQLLRKNARAKGWPEEDIERVEGETWDDAGGMDDADEEDVVGGARQNEEESLPRFGSSSAQQQQQRFRSLQAAVDAQLFENPDDACLRPGAIAWETHQKKMLLLLRRFQPPVVMRPFVSSPPWQDQDVYPSGSTAGGLGAGTTTATIGGVPPPLAADSALADPFEPAPQRSNGSARAESAASGSNRPQNPNRPPGVKEPPLLLRIIRYDEDQESVMDRPLLRARLRQVFGRQTKNLAAMREGIGGFLGAGGGGGLRSGGWEIKGAKGGFEIPVTTKKAEGGEEVPVGGEQTVLGEGGIRKTVMFREGAHEADKPAESPGMFREGAHEADKPAESPCMFREGEHEADRPAESPGMFREGAHEADKPAESPGSLSESPRSGRSASSSGAPSSSRSGKGSSKGSSSVRAMDRCALSHEISCGPFLKFFLQGGRRRGEEEKKRRREEGRGGRRLGKKKMRPGKKRRSPTKKSDKKRPRFAKKMSARKWSEKKST